MYTLLFYLKYFYKVIWTSLNLLLFLIAVSKIAQAIKMHFSPSQDSHWLQVWGNIRLIVVLLTHAAYR